MRGGRYFAGAGLLVLPFIISLQGEQMREPKARFLVLLAGLYLASELWRKIHPSLGFAAAVFFLSAQFRSVAYPFQESLTFAAALISCFWVAYPRKSDVRRGLEVLELSGLLVAFYACVIQYGGLDPIQRPTIGHTFDNPMAFFGQHTLYGPFAVACFASALFSGRYFRSLLLFIPIFLVSTSFTYLSLAAVFALYGIRLFGKKAALSYLMAGIVASVALYKVWPDRMEYNFLNDNGRFRVWELVMHVANRHPVMGHGAASFRVIFPILQAKELREANLIQDSIQSEENRIFFRECDFVRNQWGIFMHPHNEALSVYFEFGLIGLIAAAWWLYTFFSSWWRLPDEPQNWALLAIMAAMLVNALGNFPFHLIPQALLPLWAFVAVTTSREASILDE